MRMLALAFLILSAAIRLKPYDPAKVEQVGPQPSGRPPPPQPVADTVVDTQVDNAFVHKTINYNIKSFNCATLVHILFSAYGIKCSMGHEKMGLPSAKVFLPNCSCDPDRGCQIGNGLQGVESWQGAVNHFIIDEQETHHMSELVADGSVAKSISTVAATPAPAPFEVTVVKTFDRSALSYHVGVLCRWNEPQPNPIARIISFAGWPYDTASFQMGQIVEDTKMMVGSKNFKLCFPDPTMRNAVQNTIHNRDGKAEDVLTEMGYISDVESDIDMMPSNTTLMDVKLEGCPLCLKDLVLYANDLTTPAFRFPPFKYGQTLVDLLQWPSSTIEKLDKDERKGVSGSKYKFTFDDPPSFIQKAMEDRLMSEEQALKVSLIQFKDQYFHQRPRISWWMQTFFHAISNEDMSSPWERTK